MKKLLLLALLMIPTTAHADVVKDAANSLTDFGGQLRVDEWAEGTMADANKTPAKCFAAIKAAKKAGVKNNDILIGYFQKHPNAKVNGYEWEITFGDATWICEEYERQYNLQSALVPLRKAADLLANNTNPPTAESAHGYNIGAGSGAADAGRACLKAVDAVIAGGVPASTKVTIRNASIALSDAKLTYCQGQIDWGEAFEVFIVAEKGAKRDEIAKKYTALGVAGDRLELFIEYDDVYWYGKGCVTMDDIHDVVKAKKLFQWLDNSDGTITIRTYSFKGNKYKAKDKTYKTQAKAYKGCK